LPSDTRLVRSRTTLGSDPGESATTRPTFSATYSARSPTRTAIATGCSSWATGTSRIRVSARRGSGGVGPVFGEAAGDVGPALPVEVDAATDGAASSVEHAGISAPSTTRAIASMNPRPRAVPDARTTTASIAVAPERVTRSDYRPTTARASDERRRTAT